MTPKEVQDLYKKYVLGMKAILSEGIASRDPSSTAGVELVNLVRELSALLVRVLALTPIVARQMHQQDNPPTPISVQENLELNCRIADKLNLSDSQRRSLVQTVQRFSGRLEGIVKERQQIFARMQPELQDPSTGPSSEKAIDGFLLATQGTIALKENLRQEHWEVLNLLTRCFQITNVMQTAIFMAESYPRWFDWIALASAVAQSADTAASSEEFAEVKRERPPTSESADEC
eukprot:jgi/Botrbrau1/21073/Bobra.0144s0072.1